MPELFHPAKDPQSPVVISRCDDYDPARVTEIIARALDALGVTRASLAGKRVAIKPNLVMKKPAEAAATVHPAILSGLLAFLDGCDCADVVVAESPGGIYTETALRANYRVSGMEAAAEGHRARLNYDVTARTVSVPEGKVCRQFEIITPIADADVIFNLSKLKSHALTRMSGAVKNTFGTIPGFKKFEYHAQYNDYADFNEMLVDLSLWLHTKCARMIDIQDAVIGMEGNGPTGGTPRKIGAILCSENPFNLDRVAEAILGCPGEVPMVRDACARGLCPDSADAVPVIGESWHTLAMTDFRAPDTQISIGNNAFYIKAFSKWFKPHPEIRVKTCIGCGECVRSCPVHTITLETGKDGKKHAQIHKENCIRCFCCQELCPIHSVDIHRSWILRLLAPSKR